MICMISPSNSYLRDAASKHYVCRLTLKLCSATYLLALCVVGDIPLTLFCCMCLFPFTTLWSVGYAVFISGPRSAVFALVRLDPLFLQRLYFSYFSFFYPLIYFFLFICTKSQPHANMVERHKSNHSLSKPRHGVAHRLATLVKGLWLGRV